MRDDMMQKSSDVKSRQYLILAMGVTITSMIGILVYLFMGSNENKKLKVETLDTTSFASPIENVNTQAVWIERAQNQLKDQQRQTDELKQTITQLKDDKSRTEGDPKYQALKEQVELLQKSLDEKNTTDSAALAGGQVYKGNVFPSTPGADVSHAPPDLVSGSEAAGIDNDELELKPSGSVRPKKNADTYVPAGTFVEAIMLGAADASAGVNGSANPSPLLFRVVADGTLPNHQKSHLKDCVVTAAVVGDISSERGQIRIERMSCTFPNGEIVEQQVQGTVFGMDAKNGVRGNPVWREGALLGRAAIAGTLSGIGSGISQSFTTNSISPLGTTQTVNGGDIFKYGAAQGASNAMSKLADYNIRRAEQYHPVIQLSAGQPVDVVFLTGFYLDGRKNEEVKKETDAGSDLFSSSVPMTGQVSAQTAATGLTLSQKDVEKINQHEASMGWVSPQQSGEMQ
jgi:conjugal transfer pilus assembly protein TraB